MSEERNMMEASGSDPGPSPRLAPRRRWTLLAGAVLLGCGAWLGYEAVTWPDVGWVVAHNPQTFAALEAYEAGERADGREPHPYQQWVPYRKISPHLKRAVLVAEDINFFSHHGFDTTEIETAVKDATEKLKFPRGASTLSQQLARTIWLPLLKSPDRKFKEMLLTIQLERRLTKKRIFELYLNLVPFAPGIFGAEAASRYYFHKPAADLDETEAAELAAGLCRVGLWNPASSDPAYHARVRLLLRRMEKAQFLWNLI